jgi:cellulose synthase/poly-beta-1,6-N-acetylglucosamine synthase-like glycosyltransferase
MSIALLYQPYQLLAVIFMFYVTSISLALSCLGYYRLVRGRNGKRLEKKDPSELNAAGDLVESKDWRDLIISIIIPSKNEARFIGRTIRNLESTTFDRKHVEIILVDAGCQDNTIEIAKASAGLIKITYLKQQSDEYVGRGTICNSALKHCRGDIVLLLRADSLTPPNYDEALRRSLSTKDVSLACFELNFDRNLLGFGMRRPPDLALWMLETLLYCRAKYCMLPHGAQGLAMRKEDMLQYQFSDGIILEDLAFVMEVRQKAIQNGTILKVLNSRLLCNPDPWVEQGVVLTTLINQLAHFTFMYTPIPAGTIHEWYFVRFFDLLRVLGLKKVLGRDHHKKH